MPDIDTLREGDKALNEMYAGDTAEGKTLSPEDEQAFKDLIEEQRTGYQETLYAKKAEETNEVAPAIAPSIGNAALHNPGSPESSPRQDAYGQTNDTSWQIPK